MQIRTPKSILIYIIYITRKFMYAMKTEYHSCAPDCMQQNGIILIPIRESMLDLSLQSQFSPAYSERALFVFLLRSFIIKNTRAYDVMQNRAVMPV